MPKSHKKQLICLIILLSLCFSASRDTITPSQFLPDGEVLVSSGGTFTLGFFIPANASNNHRYIGIWYSRTAGQEVIWVANRRHPIISNSAILSIAINGSLLVTDGESTIIWWYASGAQVANPTAQLLENGNFIVTNHGD